VADLADELVSQRAQARIGECVQVLVEEADEDLVGRAAHQGPEVDGSVRLVTHNRHTRGDLVDAIVSDCDGADLVAIPTPDERVRSNSGRMLTTP
jgi:ribosomal protein S12 methylthiotransferase